MPLSITKLRSNIYKVVDQVITTYKPITIERNGYLVELSLKKPRKKSVRLEHFKPHPDYVVGDLDDFVHLDWLSGWPTSRYSYL